MPEHASRAAAALYDQFEDEHPVADWGGDDLFTRMPRPRAVDDAPAPRFRPYLAAAEPESDSVARASTAAARASASAARASASAARASASVARASGPAGGAASRSAARASGRADGAQRPAARRRALSLVEPAGDRRRDAALDERSATRSGEQAMLDRAERLGLSVVEPAPEPRHRWDDSGALVEPEPEGRRTKVITGHPGGSPRPLPTVRSERRRRQRTPADWIGPRPERIVGWAFALGLLLILIAISTADAATV